MLPLALRTWPIPFPANAPCPVASYASSRVLNTPVWQNPPNSNASLSRARRVSHIETCISIGQVHPVFTGIWLDNDTSPCVAGPFASSLREPSDRHPWRALKTLLSEHRVHNVPVRYGVLSIGKLMPPSLFVTPQVKMRNRKVPPNGALRSYCLCCSTIQIQGYHKCSWYATMIRCTWDHHRPVHAHRMHVAPKRTSTRSSLGATPSPSTALATATSASASPSAAATVLTL